ncbi:nucleotide pyrophosphohydrolase [Patescibacteria group bacterium]|nr:nucleotide pyrophosphohydrolase [Patescibacteria group bacterium]
MDKTTTVKELKDLVEKFRQERNWGRHHSSKNLAISIAIEAAELMEHFQWDNYKEENDGELESELADIIIYCLFFAVSNKIDIAKAVAAKIDKISQKYPIAVFNSKQDDPKDYWKIKKEYRQSK